MTDKIAIFLVAGYLYATSRELSAVGAALKATQLWAEVEKKLPAPADERQ